MIEITVELVGELIAEQFPQWASLRLTPSPRQGNDNHTFRLGEELSVRLPSAEAYAEGIRKEDLALPLLAEHTTVALPLVVASADPSDRFPLPWSIRRWLPGEVPDDATAVDRNRIARELGVFLNELRAAPTAHGPACGQHSFYRGTHPSVYSDQVQSALTELGGTVDRAACEAIWREATQSAWPHDPVWFHGDLAEGNILIQDGALGAVIDFGTCGVGDPACDLTIAWTWLGEERETFREVVNLDSDTWARARGWALWKALISLTDPCSPLRATQQRALAALL